jgi:23S rRNA (cytosine1962-C5)-methyltransferase
MTAEPSLTLKPERDKSVRQRHPWIFSGAVAAVDGSLLAGDTVVVRAADGAFLARAAYSPHSQIVARIWTWDEAEPVDAAFFARRLAAAIAARVGLSHATNAVRWANAESDGLPGLIVDRYADFAVCQFLSAGPERWKREIVAAVAAQPGVRGVYERSDVDVRGKEGLKAVTGVLAGDAPPELIEIGESLPDASGALAARRYGVDVIHGHKTGFYLDQRDNRRVVAELAAGCEVLNAFAYTGAFTIAALGADARSVVSVDSAAPMLALAARNLELNGLPADGLREGDVFKVLREYRDSGQTFDLIILDPPKFAQTQAQLNKATRAYKDINWLAFRLLRPGGHLITFSCSGIVSADLFQKIVFGAALDAGRDAQVIRWLTQASDHPMRLTFPEGFYLKGLVCRV